MNRHLQDLAEYSLDKNVEEISQLEWWPVYEHYEIIPDEGGSGYIYAPSGGGDGGPNKVIQQLRPLSRTSADLFLRFARWPEEARMDKELDTPRNREAALSWARSFGVLGLNSTGMTILNIVNSRRVAADYLGMPWLDDAGMSSRNLAIGGMPDESVANFALEAWEAHIAWRLYESVRSGGRVDGDSVIHFMSTEDHGAWSVTTDKWDSWVEREIYSADSQLTRRWALTVVADAVNRKIENLCFPLLQGDGPGSYEQGWGFKSLLGAMWLQMMFLMEADRRCRWCDKPLDPGMRSHAKYCDNDGECKWKWNYYKGKGTSSKESRRQGRYIR